MQSICCAYLDDDPQESEWEMASAKEKFEEIDARLETLEQQINGIVRPQRWYSRAYHWLINHKGTSLVLSIILCAVGIFGKYWLDHRQDGFNASVEAVLNKPGGIQETLNQVQETTHETNTTLRTLQPFIQEVITHQFENVSKLSPQAIGDRLPAVKTLFAAAKDQHATLDLKLVSQTGQRLVNYPGQAPKVWEAALEFLSYKSSTNKPPEQLASLKQYPTVTTHYLFLNVPLEEAPKLSFFGIVPSASAARLNPIGQDQNADLSVGNTLLLAQGGKVILDGMDLRSVVFKNVEIDYSGGPLIISNVTFINCIFKLAPSTRGRELASAVLSSDAPTTLPFGERS